LTGRPAAAGGVTPPLIRVLIVDDSITTRTILTRIVESNPLLEVVAAVKSAEEALKLLPSALAEVVMLDLEMPGMGGLSAIPEILALSPQSRILVVSSNAVEGAEQTLAALALGATDTFPKPLSGNFDIRYREALAEKLRMLGTAECEAARPIPDSAPPATRRPRKDIFPQRVEALAIGASTGGIHALCRFFSALSPQIKAPIFITQHLPDNFMAIFARQVADASRRQVLIAEDGMVAEPDQILIAPGDAHLILDCSPGKFRARLDRTPMPNCCLPSVDPMFSSLADGVGAGAVGLILSGMGRDGVIGAARIVAAGGKVYAQDAATSAVWGMPRAVVEAGLATDCLPPQELARRVDALVSGR